MQLVMLQKGSYFRKIIQEEHLFHKDLYFRRRLSRKINVLEE